jgi:hypothetical protein
LILRVRMKTAAQIVAFIAERIGFIYHHNPLMYGGTPEGVETLLFYYHELWAEIVERQKEYIDIRIAAHEKEECNSHSFSGRYLSLHQEASDREVANYATTQWRKISDQLAIPIQHEEIIKDLEQKLDPKSLWKF